MKQKKKKNELRFVKERISKGTDTLQTQYTYGNFTVNVEADLQGKLPTSLWASNSASRDLELKAFSGEETVLTTRTGLCITRPEDARVFAQEVNEAVRLMELVPGLIGTRKDGGERNGNVS